MKLGPQHIEQYVPGKDGEIGYCVPWSFMMLEEYLKSNGSKTICQINDDIIQVIGDNKTTMMSILPFLPEYRTKDKVIYDGLILIRDKIQKYLIGMLHYANDVSFEAIQALKNK